MVCWLTDVVRRGSAVCAGYAILLACGAARGEWPQWGGPDRNFVVAAGGLRLDWPQSGPKRVWEAEIGPGSSSVIVDDQAAYTMYRSGQDEVIVAFDVNTGTRLWEYKYASPVPEGFPPPEQLGPRSTPVITGVRIFTVGSLGHIQCLNKTTGKMIWSYDPVKEFKLVPPKSGYAASPLIYKDRVLLALGSEGGKRAGGVFAFHQRVGSWLWNYHEFEPVTASPIVIRVGGKDDLLVASPEKLVGLDPLNGNIRWEAPWSGVTTPTWNTSRDALVVPALSAAGSNVLDFSGDKPSEPRRLWKDPTPKWRAGVSAGNVAIGSSPGNPAKLCAMGVFTGEELWCDETFASAQLLYTGNSLVVLDDLGTLALVAIEPDKMTVHSRTKIEKTGEWAAPALESRRLFLRDNKRVLVLDLQ